MKRINDQETERFYEAILKLRTTEECEAFFEDICTVKEIKSIAQRLLVAQMLTEKCVYSDIVKKTGASTATISRVNRSLSYGNDGYQMVFDRLREDKE